MGWRIEGGMEGVVQGQVRRWDGQVRRVGWGGSTVSPSDTLYIMDCLDIF